MRKCKHCKEPFKPRYNTIQPTCSVKCAIEYGKILKQKKADKEFKERKREFKLNDKSIQKASAQRAFNAYIRERDKECNCISCGSDGSSGVKWNAGHFKTVGARPDLRFDERNCNKQCEYCNTYLSGNTAEYRKSLIKKIGVEEVQDLERERIKNSKRLNAEDYRNIAIKYRQKLKELKAINGE